MLWRPFVARMYVIVHIFKHEYLCNQWAGVTMKFYQKHHLDGGKAASGFGPDRIKTLVSMATDSSHRVIMEKTIWPLFIHSFFIFAGNDNMHGNWEEFEIQPDPTTDCQVSCP